MILDGLNVLCTGGTGSLGTKLVETVLATGNPERLVVLSRDELKQHEMRLRFPDPRLRFFLGDVRDRDRLYRAFDGIDVVIHAAALKIVPSLEYNPIEGIKTNILGAANVIDAALDRGVTKVLAASTDKAVNPINLYGAAKLCAEKLFVAANNYAGKHATRFAVVRYGNVVCSRGSVIPIWKEHAANCHASACTGGHCCETCPICKRLGITHGGRPHQCEVACTGIQITDPRMTRFWITLDEAVAFVLASLERMVGGEVFVPKIPSVHMMDLAAAIAPDCDHVIVGIRPGEKLAEALIGPDEARHTIEGDDHYAIMPSGSVQGNLPDGWRYTSDTNDRWLDIEEIRRQLA